MKKFIIIFFILIFFVLFSEAFLGFTGLYEFKKNSNLIPENPAEKLSWAQKKENLIKDYHYLSSVYRTNPYIKASNLKDYECDGSNNCEGKIRLPDGLQYLNSSKSPIVVFGCSFAHGDRNLTQNQTFSHKLSEALHRTVYNRGIQGQGVAQMYYQSLNDDFYNSVTPSDTVIYIMIDDHYRRMLVYKIYPTDNQFVMKYNKKNNNLYPDEYTPIRNFIRSTYTASFLKQYFVYKYINNPNNAEELTDLMLLHFIKTREELEKHWHKKVNFIVILYVLYDFHYQNLLKNKLIKNGFKVISTNEITTENLLSSKYFRGHPKEEAWDLLTPLIIEKANL